MSFLLYLLIFVFVLGIIVLVHEFGHFIFARRAGILCHEFSIGMGPALYKIKKGETTYAIRAIPIGGYVSMAGEEPETEKIKKGQVIYLQTTGNIVTKIFLYKPESTKVTYAKVVDFDLYGKDGGQLYIHYKDEQDVTHYVTVSREAFYQFSDKLEIQIAPYDRCFESKPWLARFLTVVAGAGFNFILAIFFFLIISLMTGVPTSKPYIGFVSPNSPAAKIGLQVDDQIIKLGDTDIKSWKDVSNYMNSYIQGPITITVLRNNQPVTLQVTPEIFIATLGLYSTQDLDNSTELSGVGANSNADKAGFRTGDKIIHIKGTVADDLNTKENETRPIDTPVTDWYEIRNVLKNFYLSEEVTFTVLRGTETKEITVKTIKALHPGNVSDVFIGVSQKTEFNLFGSIGNGFTQTVNVIGSIFQTLDMLFTDKNVGVNDLSGPVGIYDMTKTFAMAGLVSLLGWVAFISANIGFVNLLPLPALDGGRLIFLLIEGVIRKPVNRKVEGYIHTVGFILFMMLFLYVTFNDILRIQG